MDLLVSLVSGSVQQLAFVCSDVPFVMSSIIAILEGCLGKLVIHVNLCLIEGSGELQWRVLHCWDAIDYTIG